MLLFVHFMQIARAQTTFESMRGHRHAAPIMTALATGTTNMEDASVTASGAGPDPIAAGHSHPKKQDGCLATWKKNLGLDVFFEIAFNGYHGNKNAKDRPRKRPNPFTRGMLRNCQDFWGDGPIFGRNENGAALLGGEKVDYTALYDVPRGGMRYGAGYEAVAGDEGEV
jgi:hypothetical protein